MSKWKCEICNSEFDNFQAQGFNHKIYCPLCYFKELNIRKDKEIERLKNKLIEMTEIATRKENILLELEKWITFSDTESFNPALNYDDECKMEYIYVDDLKDKLKELKEGK